MLHFDKDANGFIEKESVMFSRNLWFRLQMLAVIGVMLMGACIFGLGSLPNPPGAIIEAPPVNIVALLKAMAMIYVAVGIPLTTAFSFVDERGYIIR